jgi:hypothetical protein
MSENEGVLHEAKARFEQSRESAGFNHAAAEECIRFARLADQWPDHIRRQREAEGRPCLTINRLPAFIRQVVNDARQNKPGIRVTAAESGDRATADVIQGIVRHIERASGADVAYDTAIDHAVTGGFGFFRVSIDYAHADSFDMEARIERVPNPLMVHWDTTSTMFDASDWDFAFISEYLTEDQFEARYPDAEPVSFEGADADRVDTRTDGDDVRVVEYWSRERKARQLLQIRLFDGSVRTIRQEDLERAIQEGAVLPGAFEVLKAREAEYHVVTRRVLSGAAVLEEDEWPGSMIPICPVWGDEVILDGRRHFRSMVSDAMDPQRMFNFWRTSTTEVVALAPKAPWVGPKGFVPRGHEEKWASANARSYAYLEYEPVPGLPAPQRQAFAGVPAGAMQEALSAADDMKAITGIYDAALGARSNETSGRAILARQREADTANFHFIDNLSRAIRYCGRVLVEIIPHLYSGREAARILGEDGKEAVVRLAQSGQGTTLNDDGEPVIYDLSVGHYDVDIDSGPSYATQREEAREVIVELIRSLPGAAPYMADILFRNMDFQGADELAERAKLLMQMQMTPPGQAPRGPPPGGQPMPPGAMPPGA